jgi:hypothetical protein
MGDFVDSSIEVWNSALTGGEDDYHGNFDAPQFERWFTDLCIALKVKYGGCNIHMDGASYHKRVTNKSPTAAWRKAEIAAWVKGKFIYVCLCLIYLF